MGNIIKLVAVCVRACCGLGNHDPVHEVEGDAGSLRDLALLAKGEADAQAARIAELEAEVKRLRVGLHDVRGLAARGTESVLVMDHAHAVLQTGRELVAHLKKSPLPTPTTEAP